MLLLAVKDGKSVCDIVIDTRGSTATQRSLAEWARISFGLVLPLLAGAAALEVFVTPRLAILLFTGS